MLKFKVQIITEKEIEVENVEFLRPWMITVPSKKNPAEKFYICRCDVIIDKKKYQFQFMKSEKASNWITNLKGIKTDPKTITEILNGAMAYFKTNPPVTKRS